jgi:hypothetical protein
LVNLDQEADFVRLPVDFLLKSRVRRRGGSGRTPAIDQGTISMQRPTIRLRGFAATLAVVFVALCLSEICRADVLYSGTGSSGYVNSLGQYDFLTGSTPASASATVTDNYSLLSGSTGSEVVTGSSWASVTPGATDLMQIQNSLSSSGSSGPFVGTFSVWPESTAAASWNNVQATVTGPTGAALPSSIQLEFQINYQHPTSQNNGGGWPAFPYGLSVTGYAGYQIMLPGAGNPIQPGEQPVQIQANGSLTGSFHLDIPLSALGTSQQFGLAIGSDLAGLGTTQTDSETLSLTGVYLPNGTPISADGLNVSFESGLPPVVEPVPEPGTMAVWALMAGGGALFIHRRKSRANSISG